LQLVLSFENTFAGAVAVRNWLVDLGYEEVEVTVDNVLEAVTPTGASRTSPKTGLFGDVRPLAERLEGAPPEKIVEMVFDHRSNVPDVLAKAVRGIPEALRLELCREHWEQCRGQGRDVSWQALLMIQDLGPIAADWMRTIWQELLAEDCSFMGFATKALAASLQPDEAFDLAQAWAEEATDIDARKARLMAFGNLAHRRTLGEIERWWESAEPGAPVTDDWGRLAADSGIDWPAAMAWLAAGRPLSLVALDALLCYVPRHGYPEIAMPSDFAPPNSEAFRSVLTRYRDRDPAPRVDRIAGFLMENAARLIGEAP
jgi:hypothetical protein